MATSSSSLPSNLSDKMVSLSESKTSLEKTEAPDEGEESTTDSRKVKRSLSSGQKSPPRKVSRYSSGSPILLQQVRVALQKLSSPSLVHLNNDNVSVKKTSDTDNHPTSPEDDEAEVSRLSPASPSSTRSSLEKSKITQYLAQRKDGIKPVTKLCDDGESSPTGSIDNHLKTESNSSIKFSSMEISQKINNNLEAKGDDDYSKTSDLKVVLSDVFDGGKKIVGSGNGIEYISQTKQPILSAGDVFGEMNDSSKSKDDSASVVSSTTSSISSASSCSSYDHLFEIPKSTARFPSSKGSVSGCLVGPRTISYSVQGAEEPASVVICKWELCGQEFDNNSKLLEHLRSVHAKTAIAGKQDQTTSEEKEQRSFKCLWEGCKVFGLILQQVTKKVLDLSLFFVVFPSGIWERFQLRILVRETRHRQPRRQQTIPMYCRWLQATLRNASVAGTSRQQPLQSYIFQHLTE